MSGFAGICNPFEDGNELTSRMLDSLKQSSPKNCGIFCDESLDVFWGQSGLAISEGNQTIVSQNRRFKMLFNGIIYNSNELSDLLSDNCRSYSCYETVLELFCKFGIQDTLTKIRGMFSIALLDKHLKRIHLVRDRAGEKPLYYGFIRNSFVFASELKCFYKIGDGTLNIDVNALDFYFKHGYVPQPSSIYQGVNKLQPGTILTISSPFSKAEKIETYWSLLDVVKNRNNNIPSYSESKEYLHDLLVAAIGEQMTRSVSPGALLSGGIDSSLMVSIMQRLSTNPIDTFTIGFEQDDFNEAIEAKKIANFLACNHTEMYISNKDAINLIPIIPKIYDEPFSDSSQIPTYCALKLAYGKVDLLLSGDAGDELFCGYRRYIRCQKQYDIINKIPTFFRKQVSRVLSANFTQNVDCFTKLNRISKIMAEKSQARIYKQIINYNYYREFILNCKVSDSSFFDISDNSLPFDNFIENMQFIDFHTYLTDDCIVKVDRPATAIGIDVRAPMLDKKIIEFAFNSPLEYKYSNGVQKKILRDILSSYIPDSLWDRKKMGFGVPIDTWLKTSLRDWADSLIFSDILKQQPYLNYPHICDLWLNYKAGKHANYSLIWNILMFAAWLDEYR